MNGRNGTRANGGTRYAQITGWGCCVPDKVVTNEALARIVDTTDEWITSRTGIKSRHIVGSERETTAVLATRAGRDALLVAGLPPSRVDLIIVATATPEYVFPSTASVVQDALGASTAGAFDLSAGCSGFIYALNMAIGEEWRRRQRAGHRRGDALADHRLDGPQHVRAVRRWGGCGRRQRVRRSLRRAGDRIGQRRLRRGAADPSRGRQPPAGEPGQREQRRSLHQNERPRGIPVCHDRHAEGDGERDTQGRLGGQRRLADYSAPGQHAHHRVRGAPAERGRCVRATSWCSSRLARA